MKQSISFLLFFSILISISCSLFANPSSEKNEFISKIKEGDSWNMSVNIPVNPLNINIDNENLLNVKALNNILAKSDWEVECLKSSKNGIQLKYTLQRLKVQADFPMKNWNNGKDITPTLFNDTQYPIYSSETEKLDSQNLIGKSFVYSGTFESQKSSGEIVDNEFVDRNMDLKLHNVSNSKGIQFEITFNLNVYELVGPLRICYHTTLFNSIQTAAAKQKQVLFKIKEGDKIVQDTIDFDFMELRGNVVYLKNKQDSSKILVDKNTNLPFAYDNGECYLYNFPYFKNTQISGNVEIADTICLATFSFYNSRTKKDKTVKIVNGKFNVNLDLSEPEFIKLKIDGKEDSYFYLKPGMQISLNWKSGEELPRVEGFGSADVECVIRCMDLYRPGNYEPYMVKLFRNLAEKRKSIIEEYENGISTDILELLERDFSYTRGFCMAFYKWVQIPNGNFKNTLEALPLIDYYSEQLPAYDHFISQYAELKHRELIELSGTTFSLDDYRKNIQFAKMMYKGYPLYMTTYEILERGLLAGEFEPLQKDYDEFINGPVASNLKNELTKIYDKVKSIKKGQELPVREFYDIEKGKVTIPKGEITILNLNFSNIGENSVFKTPLNGFETAVAKDSRIKKVNIFIVRLEAAKGVLKEFYFDNINVEYIYVSEKNMESLKALNLKKNKRRIFLLDKNLKIIDSNFQSPYVNSHSQFPKILDDYFESLNQPIIKADTRWLLLIILASLISFGLLSWIIIGIRTKQIAKREAAKRKLSELELRAIRSQMNPHFIFNSLNSIQNLVNKNKIEETNIYLSEFSKMMRLVLNNSEKALVPLEEEVQLIQTYLELEKLRIPFQFEIIIDPSIVISEEEIPGMLIQPFVENAVVHGIAPQKGGFIKVLFKKELSKISCEISDNGIGISKRSEQRNGNGKAIKMVRERINIVNSQNTQPLTLEITDRKEMNEKGTLVRVEIPV